MKSVILSLMIIPFLIIPAYAQELYAQAAEAYGVHELEKGLTNEERSITGELQIGKTREFSPGVFIGRATEKLKSEVKDSLGFALALGAITVLSSAASSMCGTESVGSMVNISAVAAGAMVVLSDVTGVVTQTVDAMTRLSDYSKAAMPVLFTAAASCGQTGASCAKYAAVSMAMDMVMTLSQRLLVPGIYAYIALSLSDSLFPNAITACFANTAKWAVTTAMTFMTIALSAYIGTTGLVAGSVDAAAVRTAKTVLTSALPVVGGIISDASGAVLSAAAVIKYSAGAFALAAVCAMCIGPVAVILVRFTVLKLFSAFAEAVPGVRLGKLLSSVGNAMALLLGLLGCCSVMLFVSVTAGIKAVSL